MRDSFRYLVAGFFTVAGIFGLEQALSGAAWTVDQPSLWLVSFIWLAIAFLLIRQTRLWRQGARRLRGKQDARRDERRKEAMVALLSDGETDRVLEAIRMALGAPPRSFSHLDLSTYLLSNKPAWCKPENPLSGYFAAQKDLLREGLVVWAKVVQMNAALFYPGPTNAPGDVVYCLDPDERNVWTNLEGISRQLYASKATIPADPQERAISDRLADEHTPGFGEAVPIGISPWMRCAVSTIYVDRKHLPDGKVSMAFFPVLLSPTEPRYVMIVPSRYWPDILRAAWSGA